MMTQPLCIDIAYDDPIKLFAPHANKAFAQILDSSLFDEEQGRYSFIAMDPFEIFDQGEDSFARLQRKLAAYNNATHPNKPPFQGGILGYFGYELLHQLEKIPRKQDAPFSSPDICLGFYDVVASFDHKLKKAYIFSSGFPETGSAQIKRAKERADWLKDVLFSPCAPAAAFQGSSLNWQSPFSEETYKKSVQKIIDYICAGDIFQANLTQRFTAQVPEKINRFSLYQKLRALNPAPFSAYLNLGNICLASSSPERFLKVQEKQVETRPIKGTRARLNDKEADRNITKDLLNSEKERAENTMIVDLLRNDLSKQCEPHSVKVPELCALHSFATVHHLVSTVTGILRKESNALDLLKSCFPGGSITGAPKVRAMEIISELEPTPRGPYCGAIGYIGFDGTMDTNIVIRTLIFKGNQVALQVGGGIVVQSDPQDEYIETLTKASALFRAFEE